MLDDLEKLVQHVRKANVIRITHSKTIFQWGILK